MDFLFGNVPINTPLRPPPPGVVSSFANQKFLGRPVVVSAAVCVPLIFLLASVRIYARVLLKKWTLQDYVFCLSCLLGVTFIAFSIPLTLAKHYGQHVWDINTATLTKPSLLRLHVFAVVLGPVLWFTKVTLFVFLTHVFKSVRWFKNSAFVGIIITGIVFSVYTCTISMACAPRPGSDVQSYINGFRRESCSSKNGLNVVVSLTTSFINGLTNLYLICAALALIPTLNLTARERQGAYLMHFSGVLACVCSFVSIAYRIKAWNETDITGNQIPLNVASIFEVTLSLIIPCMPSICTIYHKYTYIEVNEKITIGTPNTGVTSVQSFYTRSSPSPAPTLEQPKSTWRKTHLSVEELPFRRASSEFYRGSALTPRDSRMKALPCTPLPAQIPIMPKTPLSPDSVRSMHLPIILETSDDD